MKLIAINTIQHATTIEPEKTVFDATRMTAPQRVPAVARRVSINPGEEFDTAVIGMSDEDARGLIAAGAAKAGEGNTPASAGQSARGARS